MGDDDQKTGIYPPGGPYEAIGQIQQRVAVVETKMHITEKIADENTRAISSLTLNVTKLAAASGDQKDDIDGLVSANKQGSDRWFQFAMLAVGALLTIFMAWQASVSMELQSALHRNQPTTHVKELPEAP